MINPLLDKEFLRQLDLYRHRVVYAKIILLSFDEQPIEEIQGRITTGSVNIDGSSALRRTCSLTMVTQEVNQYDVHWAVKNKFILYVGIENHINDTYPDIIWFKQGVFVISSISFSISASAYTINISGKDKMCLLNGELGGSITASTDFGQIDEYEEDENFDLTRTTTSYPIVDVIKNMVHAYGNELLENIIINDVDNYGLELLEYRTSTNEQYLYYLRQKITDSVTNMKFTGSAKYYYISNGNIETIRLDQLGDDQYYVPNSLTADGTNIFLTIYPNEVIAAGPPDSTYGNAKTWRNENGEYYYGDTKTKWVRTSNGTYEYDGHEKDYWEYNIMRVENGDTAGYRKTDLTYPGELIGNVNESIVSVLDKIKNTFTDFEYFYDVDGHFIFQKKDTFINESWNNIVVDQDQIYAENNNYYSQAGYSFEEGILLSQINVSPNIGDIKNDFSIWGQRALTGDTQLPIHLRYAIDFKPYIYKTLAVTEDEIPNKYKKGKKNSLAQESVIYYTDEFDGNSIALTSTCKTKVLCDWRELIYRMALDYFKYEHMLRDFYVRIAKNHEEFDNLYSTGKTGYEYYYTDMQGFWRQLYNPDKPEMVTDDGTLTEEQFTNLMGSKFVYTKTGNEYVRVQEVDKWDKNTKYYIFDFDYENYSHDVISYSTSGYLVIEYRDCWNLDCEAHPENLNFWFDFMDATGFQGKYSVSAIGNRAKAVNDTNITAIYYEDVPTTLFIDSEDWQDLQDNLEDYDDMVGYTFIQITPTLEKYFTISAQGKSAWDELNNLLYTNTQATETVTLTAIPIYYLEPNKRIFIKDNKIGVNGEYIVSKITVPLAYNGTTSITATKVSDRIY